MLTFSGLPSASRATTLTYRTNPTPSTKTFKKFQHQEDDSSASGTIPDSDQCSCTFPKSNLVPGILPSQCRRKMHLAAV
jgi:hypothetical protein